MSGRRTETMARDAQMYEQYTLHVPLPVIARRFGVTESTVRTGIRRAIQDQFRLSADEQRIVVEDQLAFLMRKLNVMLTNKHYVVGVNGKVAINPETGEPLIDDAPERATILAIKTLLETQIKLLGLNQPQRHRIEITDKMDEEIERMATELMLHGAGAPVPREPAMMLDSDDGNDS